MTGAKPGAWLTVDADWQRIVRRWPELTLTDLPDMHLEVKGFPGGLLLQGRGVFPGAAPVSPTAWQVPVRLIHEPFVSFTAARGFAPWLNEQKWFQPYAISPTPNQVFFWASPRSSFNSYAAIPVPSASGALKQAGDRLTAKFAQLNQAHFFAAPQKLNVSSNVVSVANLPPFYFPNLKPWQEPAGQFLTGGFFATAPGLKPIPANLRAQLDAPGVVYYDWESTSHRLPDLLQLFQINLVLTKHKQLEGKSAAAKWLKAIEPKLGDSVTVVKQTRPNELTFTRSAATGLTAVELESLAHWLEAPNFPGCDLRMPLRRPLHPRLSPPGPGAPMNSPAH